MSFEDEDLVDQESGDIFVEPNSGRIYRPAGTYGMWIVHDYSLTLDGQDTTTTTGTTIYTPPDFNWTLFIVGSMSGFAIVLVIFLAIREKRVHDSKSE
jgi:hypothetical protein